MVRGEQIFIIIGVVWLVHSALWVLSGLLRLIGLEPFVAGWYVGLVVVFIGICAVIYTVGFFRRFEWARRGLEKLTWFLVLLGIVLVGMNLAMSETELREASRIFVGIIYILLLFAVGFGLRSKSIKKIMTGTKKNVG